MGNVHMLLASCVLVTACSFEPELSDDVSTSSRGNNCRKRSCPDAGTVVDAGPLVDAMGSVDAGAPTTRTLPVQAILLADDDGSYRVSITASQISQWLAYANGVFADTSTQFSFDANTSMTLYNSTLLNRMMGGGDPQWAQAMAAGNTLASRYPGRVVILFRYGTEPGGGPTGSAFSGSDLAFVAASGFNATWVCGHQNISLLAHELGHYFDLAHTFGNYRYFTLAEASSALASANNNLAIFEGDGLTDTPHDPNVDEIQCLTTTQVTLGTKTFAIPRTNIMSYLDAPTKLFSMSQIAKVRAKVATRFPL